MSTKKKLMEQVRIILTERGQQALEIARHAILQEKIKYEPIHEALRYFIEEIWHDVLHPALLSLACEAVGGNPEAINHIGAALVLLAGGADVHDDIIDQSVTKDSTLTVFGKLGKDIALLAGDALLFKGLLMLHEACESLPKNQKKTILELTKQAFFEIGSAEAEEASLRGDFDLSAEKFFDIIKTKVAIAEAHMRIGAILGGGTQEEIERLSHYGRTFGILMTIRDDFIDIFELDELKNRAERECLPLPILFTFKDSERKKKIIKLLKGSEITEKEIEKILDLVMKSEGARELKKEMRSLIKAEVKQLVFVKKQKDTLEFLLWATLEDL